MQYEVLLLTAFGIPGVLASRSIVARNGVTDNIDCIIGGGLCELNNPKACCSKRRIPGSWGYPLSCSYLSAADGAAKEDVMVETTLPAIPMITTLFTPARDISDDYPEECCIALADGIVCGQDYCYSPPPPTLAKKTEDTGKRDYCVPCGLQSLCWNCPSALKDKHEPSVKGFTRGTLSKKDEESPSDCTKSFRCGDVLYTVLCSCNAGIHGEAGEDNTTGNGAQPGTDAGAGTCCIEDGIMMTCGDCPKQILPPVPQATAAAQEKKRGDVLPARQTTYDFQLECSGLLTIQDHKCSKGGNHIDGTHCANSCTCDNVGGMHCITPAGTQCTTDETTYFCLHGTPYWACACARVMKAARSEVSSALDAPILEARSSPPQCILKGGNTNWDAEIRSCPGGDNNLTPKKCLDNCRCQGGDMVCKPPKGSTCSVDMWTGVCKNPYITIFQCTCSSRASD